MIGMAAHAHKLVRKTEKPRFGLPLSEAIISTFEKLLRKAEQGSTFATQNPKGPGDLVYLTQTAAARTAEHYLVRFTRTMITNENPHEIAAMRRLLSGSILMKCANSSEHSELREVLFPAQKS